MKVYILKLYFFLQCRENAQEVGNCITVIYHLSFIINIYNMILTQIMHIINIIKFTNNYFN